MNGKVQVGIVGFGNMGSAIANNLPKGEYKVHVFDKDELKTQNGSHLTVNKSIADLFDATAVVILAVKPQDFAAILGEIKNIQELNNKLLVSVAAGVTTSTIEEALGPVQVKTIRVMPNLFVASGNGVCGICKGKYATEHQLSTVQGLFESLGKAVVVSQDKMNAVTAVSGSGPGYLCYLVKDDPPSQRIEHLLKIVPYYEKAASGVGFSPDEVKVVATATASAVIEYLQKNTEDEAAKDFCNRVTSKGGTTQAAIDVLSNNGEGSLGEAVKAAQYRAGELAEQVQNKIKEGQR